MSTHLSNLADLAALNAASEAALDGRRDQLHAKLHAVKKQLAMEAKAVRAVSVRAASQGRGCDESFHDVSCVRHAVEKQLAERARGGWAVRGSEGASI